MKVVRFERSLLAAAVEGTRFEPREDLGDRVELDAQTGGLIGIVCISAGGKLRRLIPWARVMGLDLK